MGKVLKGLIGGVGSLFLGGDDSGARKAAFRNAALQRVSNDRQLAAATAADQQTSASARRPRGRRLLMDEGERGTQATLS